MEAITPELFDAGAWIGRQQAFALIGSKCSAAQAQCLREIRESRTYEKIGVTWDEFCPRYAAISRSKADDLIRRLDEFGQAYFRAPPQDPCMGARRSVSSPWPNKSSTGYQRGRSSCATGTSESFR
jgi:hypothetical protein